MTKVTSEKEQVTESLSQGKLMLGKSMKTKQATYSVEEVLDLNALSNVPQDDVAIMACTEDDPGVHRVSIQHKDIAVMLLHNNTSSQAVYTIKMITLTN